MSETLEFPELITEAPQAPRSAIALPDLKAVALSRFGDWRPQAAALVAKYTGVVFDASTTKGYAALTEAIAEVRAPRYAAQRVSEASKSELAGVSKAIGAELTEVKKALQGVEAHLVGQKEARDAQIAEQKAAAAAADAARCAKHLDNLQRIRSYLEQATGKTAAQITKAVAAVSAIDVSVAVWEEFAAQALGARDEVVAALQRASAAAQQHEDEAAALEAQRAELERMAAAQEVEQRRLQQLAQALAAMDVLAEQTGAAAVPVSEPVAPPPRATGATVGVPHALASSPAPAPADELQALRLALDLTEYAAAPFTGRFPSHPKPAGEWWAGLRRRIEVLQPLLHTALRLERAA